MLAASDWWEHIHPIYLVAFAFFVMVLIISVVAIVAHYYHRVRLVVQHN